MAAGEMPPTGGKGGRSLGTRSVTHTEEIEVGYDLRWDIGVLVFWDPRIICVFHVRVDYTDAESSEGRHPQSDVTSETIPEGHTRCGAVGTAVRSSMVG